ncbi:hypothetical protein ACTFR8_24530 [Bacillus cereus group sp. MYBK15-3]|uniref:hypothetical protein n=1 Tax=Bacillus cereus group TaxID=86661 RepID=UPI001C8B1448|nr:hypothetical protein [Bacillus cereus]MBX9158767.1 hypothetical protein [Bacillus cereus]
MVEKVFRIYVETGMVFDFKTDCYDNAKALVIDLEEADTYAKVPEGVKMTSNYFDFDGVMVHTKAKIIGVIEVKEDK